MAIRGFLAWRAGVLASAALLVTAVAMASPSKTATVGLEADIAFTCMWWSEAQMEGLNPNAPPPKNTEVTLKKWEYSDPVGVPHPDVIDVVVTLTNTGSEAISNMSVEVAGQWKTGPLRDEGRSTWSDRVVLKKFRDVTAQPSAAQKLRVPVDVKAMMDSLGKERKWPYALRATAVVRAPGKAQPVAESKVDLPIRPGD